MFKRLAIAGIVLGAALVLACGSAEVQTVPAAAPEPTRPAAPAPDTSSSAPQPAAVQVGSGVGDRVAEFKIRLGDGIEVTSAGLVTNERPAFLFFFATT